MEVITKNWNTFKLKTINDLSYELLTNERVITTFTITPSERLLIEGWASFRYDNVLTIGDDLILALEEKQDAIDSINLEFENNIKDIIYSKNIWWVKTYYTEWEMRSWTTKIEESKKVIWWWVSNIIDLLSSWTWLTSLQYANMIISKSDAMNLVYIDLEKKKNLSLSLIK